ncbi:MAG: DUF3604 domain-containing protein [Nitriliruptor sp.]
MDTPIVTRRTVLRAGAAAGAFLLARPTGVLAQPLGPRDAYGTSRASRLFPGSQVVHADLHNHTLLSDGAGDPGQAFASMRDAGLDVAALTDHSTVGQVVPGPFDVGGDQTPCFGSSECQSLLGIDEGAWQRTGELADAADTPGEFTAIRGFEWSSPTLGHMNVWFSQTWSDPLSTGGLGSIEDLVAFAEQEGIPVDADALGTIAELIERTPVAGLGMAGWYEWLKRPPSTPAVGGGGDALMGFNHPGREPFRFSDFAFDAGLLDRVVSLEIFNRREDYLFEVVRGRSPLVACLDAGWRPGLLGVTDQHGTDWGFPDGLGRGGYYVDALSREGVRAAMEERRFFATNLKGLRIDAAANGVRMGRTLGHRSGPVTIDVDVDRGPSWIGHQLVAQVLTTGPIMPEVVAAETIRVPAPGRALPRITVDVDAADVPWLVLRLSDPSVAADDRADATYAGFGAAIAYASPWYLDPELALPPVTPVAGELPSDEAAVPPEPPRPRVDTPAGRLARSPRAVDVPDRGPLPVTGGGPTGPGALLLGAAASLLALRRRQAHEEGHTHEPEGS